MLTCEYCNSTLSNKTSLNYHLRTTKFCLKLRGIEPYPKYECESCGKKYTNKETRDKHQKLCKEKLIENNMVKVPDYKDWIFDPEGYRVYSDGRIYSKLNSKLMKTHMSNGKPAVTLRKIGDQKDTYLVSHMVATMFCINPDNKVCVVNLDKNPLNNDWKNLMWSTQEETGINRDNKSNCVKVYQILSENEIIEYNSITEASESTGVGHSEISACCRGKRKTTKDRNGNRCGWKYVEEPKKNSIPDDAVEIAGYPGYYITPTSDIYSSKSNKKLKQHINKSGYNVIRLRNGSQKEHFVHRLMAEAFIQDKPENYSDLHVNHKDKDRTNNNIENLEYVTAKENNNHAWGKKVYLYIDNKLIEKFDSIKDAADYEELSRSAMCDRIKLKIIKRNRLYTCDPL